MKTGKMNETSFFEKRESMKTILVTGGTGFLGANLCHRLIANGYKVICLDNNYTGRFEHIADLTAHPNFEFIKHDVTKKIEINEPIHQIYNLACPASPVAYQGKHAIDTTKTCVLGAINVLELAKQHHARILQTSTSEIYGKPLEHPQTEKYLGNVNPIGIRACYDEGKRCAESLFFDYHRYEDVEIKVVRIFNTYGPYMNIDDGRVVSNFIYEALAGKNITIYGDGLQTRSFCYVDDLIDALVLMMNSDKDFTGPVNLGNPEECSIKQLADMIIQKIDSSLKVVYQGLPADDPIRRKPDIALAQSKLNWTPKIKLNEGLDKTIAYFKSVLSSNQK